MDGTGTACGFISSRHRWVCSRRVRHFFWPVNADVRFAQSCITTTTSAASFATPDRTQGRCSRAGDEMRRLLSELSSSSSALARWAPLPLRLMVGYGFMAHGVAKLSRGPDVFAGILQAMSVPAPDLMAWLTIVIEVVGGLAVILGAFILEFSVPMAAVLLVAMFTAQLPNGFISIKLLGVTSAGPQFGPPGYEINLLYLACLATLVLGGPGPLAIDHLILGAKKPWESRTRSISGRRAQERTMERSQWVLARCHHRIG